MFYGYIRVSTDRQAASGLGLDAQRHVIEQYVAQQGGELAGMYIEVESGKLNDRPELNAALARCRKHKATLVIAKLDRLARNVAFVSALMETGIDFVAVDAPFANRLMIHVLSAVAEFEREQISERTKAALAAAKARGVQLGTHGKVLAAQRRTRAEQHARTLAPYVAAAERAGCRTVRDYVTYLNEASVPTQSGTGWQLSTTHRLLRRLRFMDACK